MNSIENAKVAKSLCDSAYEELISIRRDSNNNKKDLDLDYRLDWAMTRLEYAMGHLNENIFKPAQ